MSMPKKLKLLFDNFEEYVGTLLTVVMGISVTLGVVTRVAGVPLDWSGEVARYSFIWAVMMGAVIATKRNGHIIIDVFVHLFPPKLREYLIFVNSVLILGLLLTLAYFGIVLSLEFWDTPMSLLPYSIGFVYLSLPVCSLLMAFRMLQNMRHHYLKKEETPS